MRSAVLAPVLVVLAAAPAWAGSITTLFSSNNFGALGGGVFFDIVVGARDIYVTGLKTNTSSMSAFTMGIYTRSGSHVGAEQSAAGWTLRATGSGTGLGTNAASAVALSNSIRLLANTTYGIALDMDATARHQYSNGLTPVTTYANTDLALKLGSAMNTPFAPEIGGPSTPRVWNGTLEYLIPLPSSAAMTLAGFGVACGARRRRRG